jgi:4-amino-4-deoxy-L-arabinose transferase-like glycosyltransferase
MTPRATLALAVAILVWAALVVVGLMTRPPLPVDETRYLAVAWEMWRSGDYLVPRLNGIEYHHKPPLLFWMMTLGWHAFGVSETWARLVAPLFALGSLLLTAWLGRLLFPRSPTVAGLAPILLVGAAFFALFASLTFFDMLVTFFTLLGLAGTWIAANGHARRGWLLFALALGLGILSKGPVQLLNLAAAPLLAPLWVPERPASWRRWYGGLVFAIVLGAAIALAWALPAAVAGGSQFAYMLFIGQTTERVVEALWHERPWWWYLPLSFALLFPWLWWVEFWRGLLVRGMEHEPGARFCLAMIVPVFIAFSAISGKQPHYLLPIMPVFALLAARLIVAAAESERFVDGRLTRLLTVLPPLTIGAALVGLAFVFAPGWLIAAQPALAQILPLSMNAAAAGTVLLVLGVAVSLDCRRAPTLRAATLTVVLAATIIAVEVAASPHLFQRYSTAETAAVLAQAQSAGKPIAHIDDYHGQYHFAGRLERPIEAITEDEAVAWANAHPDGLIVDYRADDPATYPVQPEFSHPYRGRFVVIWPAAEIAAQGRDLLIDRPN